MAKVKPEKPKAVPNNGNSESVELSAKLVLNGAEIVALGPDAELLVGGKNYNTAIISQVGGIQAPQFRAVSSLAFHKVLDECSLNAALVRMVVEREYKRIDWMDPEISGDSEFLQKFVRTLGKIIRDEATAKAQDGQNKIKLRTFINNVVDGFATSPESIDQLRKRSVMVQAAILSVELPKEVAEAVKFGYAEICREAGEENVPIAVRSSAAGEDSRKKAFAGLQDTYLNMNGPEQVVTAYHWDCSSAYNLRSMTYRRESILDAIAKGEETGDESLAANAKQEWAIENTSLSVCLMRMINPLISGTAFSADTATGCRGTVRNDLVSIDVSYGLGEAVVGGMVTPDKYYVFQRDDGQEVVIRQMGCKDKKIVYELGGGTKRVEVPDTEIYRWALSLSQAEKIAKGVRGISKAYGGMIMDSEFCIDAKDELWFVQARPETRWNEEFELHPHTIYMRRKEVDEKYLAGAEVLLEGNGASRGAGQGTARFLRSALELNKINKGDILVAERTDPDMVPGMRMASAIIADVGGDTSHAAITSRELGIPAVIGVQRADALRALDDVEVTVDGTTGRVYKGLLPLKDVGGEMDLSSLPTNKTKVGLILADVNQAMFLSRLRNQPDFEVGLLRAEFMLGNISVHPAALAAYDRGELENDVNAHLNTLEEDLNKTLRAQYNAGLISGKLRLREYVGCLTGLVGEIAVLSEQEVSGTDQTWQNQRKIRDLENRLDDYVSKAAKSIDILCTSANLVTHVRIVFGYEDELANLVDNSAENVSRRAEIDAEIKSLVERSAQIPFIQQSLEEIKSLRAEVAMRN
ncbi:MAG: phosphoenolpyruvate synthase, partial [Deltaproteobacteria bacterium]|nr:phosphoenolpyruvate synthase [Deltaproteobacteria bacterium]